MRKSFLLLAVLLSIGTAVLAQKASIKGNVADSKTNDNIPFANIALLDNGNRLKAGAISDANGTFQLTKVAAGDYKLVLSFIGYTNDTIPNVKLSADQKTLDLGTLKLSPSAVALDEVQVNAMANTVTNSIDRKSYRAADFETAKGGTAVDILNKLPSVSVSPDGEVSVRGTNDFMVYLNGKPTQMEASVLLAQLASDNIDQIEIITVPSAKFDAQGKGGIINITTKKGAMQGLSIVANGLVGGSPWNNLTDKYSDYNLNDDRINGGLAVRYGKKNLTLNAGVNYSKRNVNGMRSGDARILHTDRTDDTYKHMVAAGERPEWYHYFTANAGLEYKISDKSEISAAYFYGKRRAGRSAFYVYNNFDAQKDKSGIDNSAHIYNPNTDNRYGTFHTGNIDFKQQIGEKSYLNLSALFEKSELSRELSNQNWDYDTTTDDKQEITNDYRQTDNTPLTAYRFTADFTQELSNGHKFSIGLQPQLLTIDGSFTYDTRNLTDQSWNSQEEFVNSINMKQNVYAGYIDYSGNAGKLKYMAGLRLEYTDQDLQLENANYFRIFDNSDEKEFKVQKLDYFPTLHLTYDVNETNKLSLAASRRISRPPVKNMAPFLYRRHLEVYVVGDPHLKPEYVNNLELSYDTKIGNNSIGLTAFYRGTTNAVFRVNTIEPNETVLIRSYTNSGNSIATGIELNSNIQAGSRVKLFIGGAIYRYNISGEVFGYMEDNTSTNWNLKANVNIKLTSELKFTTDVNVKSATVTAQGENELFYLTNAALSYNPKKLSNWSCTLKAIDLLNSNITGLNTRAFGSTGSEIFYQETEYVRQGRIVELSLSYTFNKKSSKAKTNTQFGKKEF